ncbi:MAG: B12-binding domain-containing radical SAM protein [bacterium]|nr:B12-binding domain-containing radical SAM protein [bacterium]
MPDRNLVSMSSPSWGTLKTPIDKSQKNTRILLVYPGIAEEPFFNLEESGWMNTWHHLGFSILSACLKNHCFPVSLIDFRDLISWAHFKTDLEKHNPDMVLLTAPSVLFDRVLKIAEIVKSVCPKAIVVLGGVHSSLVPEDGTSCPYFDHVVRGEGETPVLDLAYATENGSAMPRLIQGLVPDLADIPFPDRDLFTRKEDPGFFFIAKPHATVLTSRGCPYHCNFCQPATNEVFGNRVRQRPVKDVISELSLLQSRGVRSIRFLDDLFMINGNWIAEFCRQYRVAGFQFQMTCQARTDIVVKRRDLMSELRDLGLEIVHIGFESGSQRILDYYEKSNSVENNLEALAICSELGIIPMVNYIFGAPGELAEDMQMTIDALNLHRIKYRSASVLYPAAHTALKDKLEAAGEIPEDLTAFYSNMESIREINEYSGELNRGFIKSVDYNLVDQYMKKSELLDYGPNPNFIQEVVDNCQGIPRLLILHPDDPAALMPVILRIAQTLGQGFSVDLIVPSTLDISLDDRQKFNDVVSLEDFSKGQTSLDLVDYGVALIPVMGENFYCGWNSGHTTSAILLKRIQAQGFAFVDQNLDFTFLSKSILKQILPTATRSLFSTTEVYTFNNQLWSDLHGQSSAPVILQNAREHPCLHCHDNDESFLNFVFFGAGAMLKSTLSRHPELMDKHNLVAVVDNDPAKAGKMMAGREIVIPDQLVELKPQLIIVTSMYHGEILIQLAKLSRESGLEFDVLPIRVS